MVPNTDRTPPSAPGSPTPDGHCRNDPLPRSGEGVDPMRLVRTAARPRTSAAGVAAAVAAFSLVGLGAAAAPAEPASVLGSNLAVNSADACVDSDEVAFLALINDYRAASACDHCRFHIALVSRRLSQCGHGRERLPGPHTCSTARPWSRTWRTSDTRVARTEKTCPRQPRRPSDADLAGKRRAQRQHAQRGFRCHRNRTRLRSELPVWVVLDDDLR